MKEEMTVILLTVGSMTSVFAAENVVTLPSKVSSTVLNTLKSSGFEAEHSMGGRIMITATLECKEQDGANQSCTITQQPRDP